MASPHPKPVALKVLEGNPGKRKLPNIPTFAPLTEEPPVWLEAEARAEYRRLYKEFSRVPGLLQRTHRTLFIAWCEEHANYVNACKERGKITDVKKRKIAHQQARESLDALLRLSGRFGLTPSDQCKLDMQPAEEGHDPFLELLT